MVEYRDIIKVDCRLSNNKWNCELTRILSDEPKEINENLQTRLFFITYNFNKYSFECFSGRKKDTVLAVS